MKLWGLVLAAALSGLGGAAKTEQQQQDQNAHGYLIRSPFWIPSADGRPPPTVSPPLARVIIHQRLSRDHHSDVALRDLLPPDADPDAALDTIATFGRAPPQLFRDEVSIRRGEPAQLVVLVDGLTGADQRRLADAAGSPEFVVAGSVSAEENRRLVDEELLPLGIAGGDDCYMFMGKCWSERSTVIRYDAKDLDRLISDIPDLRRIAKVRVRETLILAFPANPGTVPWGSWSAGGQALPLRRRQAESPMTEHDPITAQPAVGFAGGSGSADGSGNRADNLESEAAKATATATSSALRVLPSQAVPPCFDTQDLCISATGNCSAHGQCRNLWGEEVPGKQCWACHCMISHDGTQWGGSVCQRIDVSVPFWLIFGTSAVLIGIVTGAIGMLFYVGEERLPGVIGAGVVKKA